MMDFFAAEATVRHRCRTHRCCRLTENRRCLAGGGEAIVVERVNSTAIDVGCLAGFFFLLCLWWNVACCGEQLAR